MKYIVLWSAVLATAMLTSFPSQAQTSDSAYPGMPANTRVILCTSVTCTDAETQTMAMGRSKIQGPGLYTYLLGDIATGNMWALQVNVVQTNTGTPTEPLFKLVATASSYPLPSPSVYDYQTDWLSSNAYFKTAKAPTISIPASANDGEFTTWDINDAGWSGDLSGYLRGLPAFSPAGQYGSLFMTQIIVTVEFSDGSSAKFMYTSKTIDPGLAFTYILGTHKDKNGNVIPDAQPASSSNTTGAGGGNDPTLNYIPPTNLTNYLVPIPVTLIGTITVGPIVPTVPSGNDSSGSSSTAGLAYPNLVQSD